MPFSFITRIGGTPTPQPIVTPAVKIPLSWRTSTLPDSVGVASTVAVASSNGNVAYLCDGKKWLVAQFYATHDHGVHWQRMTDAHTYCTSMVVDAADANTVLLGGGRDALTFSTDGGATWQQRTGAPQPFHITRLVTWHSLRYAIVGSLRYTDTQTLAVSADNMQTWRYFDPLQIDRAATPALDSVSGLWVRPDTGAVLVALAGYLWESQDGGQHWLRFRGQDSLNFEFAVQTPQAEQPWHICAKFTSYYPDVPLTCTDNGGHTWHQQPVPGPYTKLLTIDADGSLLVSSRGAVFRLPAGTSQWRALGDTPLLCGMVGYASYAPSSSEGIWWTLPPGDKGACNEFATASANRA